MKPVSVLLSRASQSPDELSVVTWTRYVPGSVSSVKNSCVFSSTVAISVEFPRDQTSRSETWNLEELVHHRSYMAGGSENPSLTDWSTM